MSKTEIRFPNRSTILLTRRTEDGMSPPLDANGDNTLTLDEVRRGTRPQQAALFEDLGAAFSEKVRAWNNRPLYKALVHWVFGDKARQEFLELARIANDVGSLPGVNQKVDTGSSAGRGTHVWSAEELAEQPKPGTQVSDVDWKPVLR